MLLKLVTYEHGIDGYEEGFIDEMGRRQGNWVIRTGDDLVRTSYMDDLEHGVRELYRNDVLIVRCERHLGQRNVGRFEDFYPDGTRKEVGEFIDGRMHVWSWWSKDGAQTLIEGHGYRDEEYGSEAFRSVYRQWFVGGLMVREERFVGPRS